MLIVQIEHPVPNFDAWKQAFDSDPVSRGFSGRDARGVASRRGNDHREPTSADRQGGEEATHNGEQIFSTEENDEESLLCLGSHSKTVVCLFVHCRSHGA